MKRWNFILLFLLLWPHYLYASEPANASMVPELVALQSQGRLTVRALWAWKLVPESTAGIALEFRSLGYDLLGANKEQLTMWLQQADEGQLQLNREQKGILALLVDRMNSVGGADGSGTAQMKSAEIMNTESPVANQAGPSSAPAERGGESPESSTGKKVNSMDIQQLVANLEAQADAGNARAMLTLAMISKTGVAGPPDPYRSIKLLEDAAAAGEQDAMAALADEYESGLWIKQDAGKAKQLRQQAAEGGSQLARWEIE